MRVLFDIAHPAHVNFFKHLVYRLRNEGHDVVLVCLNRGSVPRIMAEEFPGFEVIQVGAYSRSRAGLYLRTGLWREVQLARVLRRLKVAAAVGVAAFQTAILAPLFGFRTLGVSDDPEHKLTFNMSKRFFDVFLVPECLGATGETIVTFRGLKEWAYLSPAYFTPDESALAEHGLKKRQYVFVRDVDTASLNYRGQSADIIGLLHDGGLGKASVVLSLENKRLRDRYPGWRVLSEPVRDIHSIMYYSRLAISSGDSMAREAAELGVESIYCGRREMKANQALIDLGFLRHETDVASILRIAQDGQDEAAESRQQARRELLARQWDDPNEAVYRHLMSLVEGRP